MYQSKKKHVPVRQRHSEQDKTKYSGKREKGKNATKVMKVQTFQLLEKLVVHVRFMTEDIVPKTRFLKNPDLSDGKAATILDTLKAVLY